MAYARHYVFSIGVNASPVDQVTFGLSYDLDNFQSLQWSRNASPGAQQTDPTRNWSDTNHDRLHSVLANVELSKLAGKVDVKFTYNFNRARTTYLYGLAADTTLATPTQLPALLNELNRATFDTTYMFTSKVGLGFTYWFERYRVEDFALGPGAIPQLNMPSDLLLGYQFLPYTANTCWGHLIYQW